VTKMPFQSMVISSQNDPYCSVARAQFFAKAWGSELINAGSQGHLNADSLLGDWPEGHSFLNELMKVNEHGH
jgi:predicted alpha/beta hydrolase family esterase